MATEIVDGHPILKINGYAPPAPEKMQLDLYDLSSSESGEDLSGYTVKDVVRTKRKINCTWGTLSWAEASALLNAVKTGTNISIEYPDVLSGKFETRLFYVGDRTAPCKYVRKGKLYFSDMSFNFVEHGGDVG